MPIPRRRLETEMLVRLEVAFVGADQTHDQEDRADDDMETMKTRRHVERRTVDPTAEREVGDTIFIGLNARERQAEQNCQPQAHLQAAVVAVTQRMVRPGYRRRRRQQDDRVEERHAPGIEGDDPFGRPDIPHRFGRIQGGIVIGPEPRHEKHHLGGDEQQHAVAQAELHDRGMKPLMFRFARDVAPPHQHGVAGHRETDDQWPYRDLAHEQHKADRQDQGAERTDDRPRARIDHVVAVSFCVCVGHSPYSCLKPRCGSVDLVRFRVGFAANLR